MGTAGPAQHELSDLSDLWNDRMDDDDILNEVLRIEQQQQLQQHGLDGQLTFARLPGAVEITNKSLNWREWSCGRGASSRPWVDIALDQIPEEGRDLDDMLLDLPEIDTLSLAELEQF